jgi:hypothetical protein
MWVFVCKIVSIFFDDGVGGLIVAANVCVRDEFAGNVSVKRNLLKEKE